MRGKRAIFARHLVEVQGAEFVALGITADEERRRGLRLTTAPAVKRVEREHGNKRFSPAKFIFLNCRARSHNLIGKCDSFHRRDSFEPLTGSNWICKEGSEFLFLIGASVEKACLGEHGAGRRSTSIVKFELELDQHAIIFDQAAHRLSGYFQGRSQPAGDDASPRWAWNFSCSPGRSIRRSGRPWFGG